MEVAIHAASRRPRPLSFPRYAQIAIPPRASSATWLRVGSGAGAWRVDPWKTREAEPDSGHSKNSREWKLVCLGSDFGIFAEFWTHHKEGQEKHIVDLRAFRRVVWSGHCREKRGWARVGALVAVGRHRRVPQEAEWGWK
ncbi:hypothetical protein TRAPUB_4833 [Trametes pubescens]|uniref:Uncharacterized protein n=1 Tax=Trametes pubescens TaxID=154538 RepID=A0A1M2VAL4_TRAPU|nr:hypothetical protein TRAPUB_4833 [Trametes pubescens]